MLARIEIDNYQDPFSIPLDSLCLLRGIIRCEYDGLMAGVDEDEDIDVLMSCIGHAEVILKKFQNTVLEREKAFREERKELSSQIRKNHLEDFSRSQMVSSEKSLKVETEEVSN